MFVGSTSRSKDLACLVVVFYLTQEELLDGSQIENALNDRALFKRDCEKGTDHKNKHIN